MTDIRRYGSSPRYADMVVHNNTAYWVEISEDATLDARGQIAQVLAQINATLATLGSDRTQLLQILVYLADLNDGPILNQLWDGWVSPGHAPVRATVRAGLGKGYWVEMVITAAVPEQDLF